MYRVLKELPHWAWWTVGVVVAVGAIFYPSTRCALWSMTVATAKALFLPLRGRTSKAFARWQREKVLARDVNHGAISPHNYIRARRNWHPRGTIDLFLPRTLTPGELLEHREGLGWFFRNDPNWCLDCVHLRKNQVRLIGKDFFPKLTSYTVRDKDVRKALAKVRLGIYLGCTARAKHFTASLEDVSLVTAFGRPGAGKSLVGFWAVTSLLMQGVTDIAIYDNSGVDFREFDGRCRVFNDLTSLNEVVKKIEEAAGKRLESMQLLAAKTGQRITNGRSYAIVSGEEPWGPLVLLIDECQVIFSKRAGGEKTEMEQLASIAARIARLTSLYRKCGVVVICLGTSHTSGDLPSLPFTNIGIKVAGSLGHSESSRSYFGGSTLAANPALHDGRLCVQTKTTGHEPIIVQLPVGFKAATRKSIWIQRQKKVSAKRPA